MGEREGVRCRDCGTRIDPRTARLRQRRFHDPWDGQPLPPPLARTDLYCALQRRAVIVPARFIRSGLPATLRAGFDLRAISHASGVGWAKQ